MKKILVTGFDPFGGEKVNPALEVIKLLPKKIGENETGLNTGGMGVISPNPYVTDEVFESFKNDIMNPTLKGMQAEGMDFEGVIFFGLMITAKGVYLLEYNMRLGDPETQAVLPLLENDLLELVEYSFDKKLSELNVTWKPLHACCVVGAAGGYPESYKKGDVITGIENAADDELVFIAGAKFEDGKFKTNGGRVLNAVAFGETLDEAKENAYKLLDKIIGEKLKKSILEKNPLLKMFLNDSVIEKIKAYFKKAILENKEEIVEEILKILESRDEETEYFEEQDAISYEDFKRAVYKDGSFKKVFENIMFSTKVMISNKDDFLEFLGNLIKNDFIDMSMNYLESAAVMFGGDERIDQLFKEIQKRQNDENISRK